jgi:hypothetical protein
MEYLTINDLITRLEKFRQVIRDNNLSEENIHFSLYMQGYSNGHKQINQPNLEPEKQKELWKKFKELFPNYFQGK